MRRPLTRPADTTTSSTAEQLQTYGAGGGLIRRRRKAARTRRRAAFISAGILGLALLAADIYVAVAPEYQLRQPERPPASPRAIALTTATAPLHQDAPAQPAVAEDKLTKPTSARASKIVGAPSLKNIPADGSPIAIAAVLTGEGSGVSGDGKKPGGVTSLQGFDMVLALGLLGSPGGGDGGGGTNPETPGGGGTTPPDGETEPPGGGTEPPGGGTEPPVLVTPIPSAFFLFGAALAGLTVTRRRRRR